MTTVDPNRPDGCAEDSPAAVLVTRIVRVRTRTRPIAPIRTGGNVVPFPAEVVGELADEPVDEPVEEGDESDAVLRVIRHLNRDHALVIIGGKARILWETDTDEAGFRLLEIKAFHDLHASALVNTDEPKSGQATKAWFAHADRRTLLGINFAPGQAARDNRMYNTWRGFAVPPDPEGDCDLFLEHLRVNVARGNEEHYRFIFGWMAQMIQEPENKIGVSIGLRGPMGCGKTKVGEVLGRLFPAHYILLDQADQLTGRFSGHLDSRLLIHADEAFFAGSKAELGRLKNLITSNKVPIERKNQDIVKVANFARLLITSNNEWVVQAAPEERRFAVFDVGTRNLQDHDFFAALDRQLLEEGGLGRLLHELQTFDLSTINLWRIPQTDALIEQKVKSLKPIDRFFYERLLAGQLMPDAAGWSRATPKAGLLAAVKEHTRAHHVDKTMPTEEELSKRIKELFLDEEQHIGSITTRPRVLGARAWCYTMPNYATCCGRFEDRLNIPVRRAEGDPDAAPAP